MICDGAFPRIHDRKIAAHTWLDDYVTTYIQRDVRQVINVGDLTSFTTFVRLAAGRSAQELNLTTLAADAGVVTNTAKAWLSVLETSFLCLRLPPRLGNLRKQLVKAPKLHFVDSGLLCLLLGIREADQLRHHPLRGAVFESWIVAEIYKVQAHAGQTPRLFHYRESRGPEVDLVVERERGLALVEAKSAATVNEHFLQPLRKLATQLHAADPSTHVQSYLLHGGEASQQRSDVTVLGWRQIQDVAW